MLCLRCGADVGESSGLCDSCKQLEKAQREREALENAQLNQDPEPPPVSSRYVSALPKEALSSASLIEPNRKPRTLLNLLIIAFVILLAELLFFGLFVWSHPSNDIIESFYLSLVFLTFNMALVGWGWMWAIQLNQSAIICLFALFFPPLVYITAFTQFHSAKIAFVVHLMGMIFCVGSFYLFEAVQGATVFEVIKQLTGNVEG